MTVAELAARVSSFELTEWMAHDLLSASEAEHAAARQEMRQQIRTP